MWEYTEERKGEGEKGEVKEKKKKSNRNSKSVCSSSFPTPTPIVAVLSRFDFSKATASLSLSFSLIIYRDRAFAQPSSFGVSPFSVFCKSDGGLTFFSELFVQTIVLSSGVLLITFSSTCLVALA